MRSLQRSRAMASLMSRVQSALKLIEKVTHGVQIPL